MTFCLDTHCVIWGVKRQGARVAEAAQFLDWAAGERHRLLVPAVVVHEMLIQGREEQRATWLYSLQHDFLVGAFDLAAAHLAARLEAACQRPPDASRYKDRFDLQVVATALRYEADAIVSYDPDVRRLAHGHVLVRGFAEPGTLFDE